MQTFLQSAFLQALGYAIANSLWQIAFLWLIVVLINNVGSLSSAKKYFIGIVAEFAAFIWFLCTLQFYYFRCREALVEVSATASLSNNNQTYILEPTISNFSSAVLYISVKGEQLLPYLSIAYLCMLFFLVIRLSRTFYLTQQIRKEGLQKPGIDLRLFVKKTAAYLGIKKEVKIYFSNLIKSPLTLGFLKPLILVPIASVNHLTTDQLEAVLLHELAHIKRADYLINILQSVIEIILFFNPFVQLLGKLIKKERENSCDDWVLQFQYNPAMYAEALLRIACIPVRRGFTMNATGNKNDLLSRVKRMLNQQEKSYSYRNHIFALLFITIILSSIAWLNPVTKYNPTANKKSQSHRIVVEPLSASVDNPLFNPIYFLTKPIQQEVDKAVKIANDKVEEAVPVINKTTSNILAKVTPIVLEKLQNFSFDIDTGITHAMVQAKNEFENVDTKLKFENVPFLSLNVDSTDFVLATKDALLNGFDKTDWKQIGSEIQKAQIDLLSLEKDKSLSAIDTRQISNAVKNTVMQLEQLKSNNFTILKNSIISVGQKTQQKLELKRLERAARNLREKIKQDQQKQSPELIQKKLKNLSHQQKKENIYSDIEDGDALSYLSNYNNQTLNMSQLYSPLQVNNFDYTYNIVDSVNTLQSAIIVVKHDSGNDSSHVKHITVEITGNNGVKKSYEFTVEVYQ